MGLFSFLSQENSSNKVGNSVSIIKEIKYYMSDDLLNTKDTIAPLPYQREEDKIYLEYRFREDKVFLDFLNNQNGYIDTLAKMSIILRKYEDFYREIDGFKKTGSRPRTISEPTNRLGKVFGIYYPNSQYEESIMREIKGNIDRIVFAYKYFKQVNNFDEDWIFRYRLYSHNPLRAMEIPSRIWGESIMPLESYIRDFGGNPKYNLMAYYYEIISNYFYNLVEKDFAPSYGGFELYLQDTKGKRSTN